MTQPSHTRASPFVRWEGDAGISLEDRAFLNERLATYGALVATISLAFWVVEAVTALFFMPAAAVIEDLFGLQTVLHWSAAGVSALQWLLCRGRRRSLPELATIDAVGIWLAMILYVLMMALTHGRPLVFHEVLVLLIITLVTIMARAVLVPASVARTAGVSAVATVPLIVVSFVARNPDGPEYLSMNTQAAIYVCTWAVAAVGLATASARIIYGLRQQVRAAMQLGQYTLEEKIGEGGMGAVYRARHALLRRPTAVKLLPPERAGAVQIQRFEKEVQLTSGLTHPNTISIYDYGHSDDGTFYYAMEYLDGITLEDLVGVEGPLPAPRVAHIIAQAAGALAEAHAVGLIHRDVKPANIMLCGRGGVFDHVKVLDFGLVKELGDGAVEGLSGTTTLVGTPLYLSPEAIVAADKIDSRADIYALGAVTYFLLTASPPFGGESLVAICAKHLHETPEAPSKRLGAAVPPALEELVLACLAKSPDDRPSSANDLRDRLAACGLERWSEDAAQSWWQERAAVVRKRLRERAAERTPSSAPLATVAIDLTRRAAEVA